MGFRELNIKTEYRTAHDSMADDFYFPILSNAVKYDRAVGFFSASSLVRIARGLALFANNNGKMRLIASPVLKDEDLNAIREGYERRKSIIDKIIKRDVLDALDQCKPDSSNLLANLIADGILDIKIALTNQGVNYGIYHEKMGIFYDEENEKIAFSGSMNETETALEINYEAIDVYCSWRSNDDKERVSRKELIFENIWEGYENGIETIEVQELKDSIVQKYKRDSVDYQNLARIEAKRRINCDASLVGKANVDIKNSIEDSLYEYQRGAIDKWQEYGFRGIFDMATGTGKTLTALGAMSRLVRQRKQLAIIVVVPYQHLVEQWVEDLKKLNIPIIIGYSRGKYKGYRNELDKNICYYNLGAKKYFIFICTNASFEKKETQSILRKIQHDRLIVVDEAHNFGTASLSDTLSDDYEYRLALSATIERYGDESGTERLFSFFGKKCIEYSLERAISEEKLVPYYYRPIIVYLSARELEDYLEISKEMKKHIRKDGKGNIKYSESWKKLAIKRARVVAGAVSKVEKLKELVRPYKKENSILVYCGATTVFRDDVDDADIENDLRQIEYITQVLGEDLGMKVARFTSEEDMKTREQLIEAFETASGLQGLIAIKCLDEGVNIPSIKTAFILASTTNPKEYIQRRGRVLRTYPGKDHAEIYDMITLPRDLSSVLHSNPEDTQCEMSLAKNEINRMIEFKRNSMNPYDSDVIIERIIQAYSLYDIQLSTEGGQRDE